MRDVDAFGACFGPLAASELRLENELLAFKLGQTQFSYLRADGDGRRLFADTVREASTLLRDAIGTMVTGKVVPDLKEAQALLDAVEADYGPPVFDWANAQRLFDFAAILDEVRPWP